MTLVLPGIQCIIESMESKTYYVYIMANKRNGTLYIGVTSDLIQRVYQHKHKTFKGFTAKYDVDKLVFYRETGDIQAAIQYEKELKHYKREWKINLIEEMNPTWRDLSEDF
ncbi:MAG: GIY-YIG nuclease family protein [Clostridiales Family XIII bacterium]|jgi:putative endonuclease|nr:GIY-YIG nuclease family protein [Clostridiales Family XIII bacterium]